MIVNCRAEMSVKELLGNLLVDMGLTVVFVSDSNIIFSIVVLILHGTYIGQFTVYLVLHSGYATNQ